MVGRRYALVQLSVLTLHQGTRRKAERMAVLETGLVRASLTWVYATGLLFTNPGTEC